MARRRILFGEQLGPQFDDGEEPVLLVESTAAFRRRPTHRQKAHLYLSALRHRAEEDGVELVEAGTFREVLEGRDLVAVDPPSYAARRLVRDVGAEVLPSRGFVTSEAQFAEWASGRAERSLVMDGFYRVVREREGWLMTPSGKPVGGRFSFDADNRQPPPKQQRLDLPEPWWPEEDDIDAGVRRDLDRWQREGLVEFIGVDGPRRFAVTRREGLTALRHFVRDRLASFGPVEDAMLAGDWTMSHSLLSVPMNLGLLDPREVVEAALAAYDAGDAPLNSVEGFVRQIAGWRDWMWHLYWHLGERYVHRNALDARRRVPQALWELTPERIEANCVSSVVEGVRDHGWAHHIQRLMVLGNAALEHGWNPLETTEWFTGAFVDGTPWVMPTNVVGMSLHADGGVVATKPYASGGAYIDRMSDYCGGCRFDPKVRVGDDACPFTAGYWSFLAKHEERFRGNRRMAQPLAGLRRLKDLDEVVEQERHRRGL